MQSNNVCVCVLCVLWCKVIGCMPCHTTHNTQHGVFFVCLCHLVCSSLLIGFDCVFLFVLSWLRPLWKRFLFEGLHFWLACIFCSFVFSCHSHSMHQKHVLAATSHHITSDSCHLDCVKHKKLSFFVLFL